MSKKLATLTCSLLLSAGLAGGTLTGLTPAADAATAAKITSVKAVAGPGVGQVTISWKTTGSSASSFQIETGLNSFSKTNSSMSTSGRNAKVFTVAGSKRSVTLSSSQLAAAGASAASGNHLYFRLTARNGSASKAYPYLQAVMPKGPAPAASGTALRIGSFNVRTAKATSDTRSWLLRAPDVAREIRDQNAGIYALQELGPGRADGKDGTTQGTPRQTDSLLSALRSIGAGQYKLTRATPYVEPGVKHNTQGARILYDASRYSMISGCTDKTGKRNYSASCSLELPILSSDGEDVRRSAGVARFQDRSTAQRFWFASVHLDQRHSGNLSTERRYNALRGQQMSAVLAKLNALNTTSEPMVIAGDINSWQNNKVGHAPHDYLVAKGFVDTAAAQRKVNIKYPTINDFKRTLQPSAQGFGTRIDVIMVKGATGASRFVNVTKATDESRPSDHNLIVADTVI